MKTCDAKLEGLRMAASCKERRCPEGWRFNDLENDMKSRINTGCYILIALLFSLVMTVPVFALPTFLEHLSSLGRCFFCSQTPMLIDMSIRGFQYSDGVGRTSFLIMVGRYDGVLC